MEYNEHEKTPTLDDNSYFVRENSLADSELSFPEHHAVVFPKNQSFSYICDADSGDENSAKIANLSEITDQSDIISDQDLRYQNDVGDFSRRSTQKSVPAIPPTEIVDDSCVAVFHEISGEIEEPQVEDLTFNGKIPFPTTSIHVNVDESIFNCSSTTVLDSSQASLQIDLSVLSNLNATQERETISSMNNGSPDILGFESDDEAVTTNKDEYKIACDLSLMNNSDNEDCLTRREKRTLKNLHNALAGVLPPPSVTTFHLSVEEILSQFEKNNSEIFARAGQDRKDRELGSFMKPMNTIQEAIESAWPYAKNIFTHGIHYNRTKYSEKIESLSTKFAERFIGAETTSSFVKLKSPSSSKKRYLRGKKTQSPGRRLSHLAKRKAMFSCANLQKINFSSSQPCLSQQPLSRQIIVDPSGLRSRLLRVKTPKKPKQKSFTSKQKDRIDAKVAPTRETSRRALFQSPPNQSFAGSELKQEISQRVDRSKRALFSSPKLNHYSSFSQLSSTSGLLSNSTFNENVSVNRENVFEVVGSKRKRNTLEDSDGLDVIRKVARTDSHFGRSQSFTAEYVAHQNALLSKKTALSKTASDVCLSGRDRTSQYNFLTDLEKQKLLYIVSQTLQQKQISGHHERFKEYATVMAKIIKRLFLESNRRSFGSVSEQMSKIANNVLFSVLQGKTVEEIYDGERRRRSNNELRSLKPSGYVSMENSRNSMYRSASSLTSENSGQSFGMLNQNSLQFSQSENLSQSSLGSFSGIIDTGNILRENVDSEQRQKSAQKGLFSGKDQKNVSPHISGHKSHKLVGGKNLMSLLKAKRQISFDT